MHYFIDTSFFVALANPNDKYAEEAKLQLLEIVGKGNSVLTTSDYVIDEFLLIQSRIQGMNDAINWSREIIDNQFCNILYCNNTIFEEALNVFRSEVDERKPLTFTDCVVFVSQKLLKCKEILTYDKRLKNYNN